MFSEYICVLEVLADSEMGCTSGAIQRKNVHLSKGQVERVLKNLQKEGFVWCERAHYRSNVQKKVWHMNGRAVEYCQYVMCRYKEVNHQLELQFDHDDPTKSMDVTE